MLPCRGAVSTQATRSRGRVSVIIPAWKRPALLREALASVRAAQGTDLDVEIIVADNGLTQEAEALAREAGAIYLQNPVPGVAATRNAGAAAATGEYLTFLDDDDLWLPTHLRPHLALLRADTAVGAVIGQRYSVDYASLRPIGPPYPDSLPANGDIFQTLLEGGIQIGALVVRASVWDAIGPFDASFTRGHTRVAVDDWDWCLRLALHCRVGFVAEPCLLYRIRPPTPDADTLAYACRNINRHIFWTNVRRAGRRAPGRLRAARMLVRHDGNSAGRLLSHAGAYAGQRDYGAARHAFWLATRVSPLHTAWALVRWPWLRRVVWALVSR